MNTEIENHNTKAYFGKFGGQYVPETAMYALTELEKEYKLFFFYFGRQIRPETVFFAPYSNTKIKTQS